MADTLSIAEEYKISSVLFDVRNSIISVSIEKYNTGTQSWGDVGRTFKYVGGAATSLMSYVNTANFSTNSLYKQILQKLINDGYISGLVS